MQDLHNEIQEMLGQNFAIPDDVDEDELMEELDGLEDELSSELDMGTKDGVPSYLQA